MDFYNINAVGRSGWISESYPKVKMASAVQTEVCDWNFRIETQNTCGTLPPIGIYFRAEFDAPKYVTTREVLQNAKGQTTTKLLSRQREYSFEFLTDDLTVDLLMQSTCYNVTKAGFNTSTAFDIIDFDVEQQGRFYDIQKCTLKFKDATISNQMFGLAGCCFGAVYNDAPFIDSCPPVVPLVMAANDDEAASLGVQIGQKYFLKFNNPYGATEGLEKIRII